MTYNSLMKQKDFVNYILFVFILFSFFLGFYLDEDSAGGGKIDLIQKEQLKSITEQIEKDLKIKS